MLAIQPSSFLRLLREPYRGPTTCSLDLVMGGMTFISRKFRNETTGKPIDITWDVRVLFLSTRERGTPLLRADFLVSRG
jgi:hypothetical protein